MCICKWYVRTTYILLLRGNAQSLISKCSLLSLYTLVTLSSSSQLCFPCTKLTLLAKNEPVSVYTKPVWTLVYCLVVATFAFPEQSLHCLLKYNKHVSVYTNTTMFKLAYKRHKFILFYQAAYKGTGNQKKINLLVSIQRLFVRLSTYHCLSVV